MSQKRKLDDLFLAINNNKKIKTDHKITKLNDIDHVLHAGDLYIGQTIHTISPPVKRFLFDPIEGYMKYYDDLIYPHGLEKIFDEILVNAADNVYRGTRDIKVLIQEGQQIKIQVQNDGPNFTIEKTEHKSIASPDENAYQPEIAFFHCKTSSAYTKTKRITGGKFGYGAKLTSIFSLETELEMCDGLLYFSQKSKNHMKEILKPVVKPANQKQKDKPFLSFTFIPDLSLFYPKDYIIDIQKICQIYISRVIDIAGTIMEPNIKVSIMWLDEFGNQKNILFKKPISSSSGISTPRIKKEEEEPFVKMEEEEDDENVLLLETKKTSRKSFQRIPMKSFKDYVKLFFPNNDFDQKVQYFTTHRWQVCMIRNPYKFPVAVSFVNNVNTFQGGQHVQYIRNQIYDYCKEKMKNTEINTRHINQYVMIFVNACIEDPSFTDQSKTYLKTVSSAFGSVCQLSDSFLNGLNKMGIMEDLKKFQEMKDLQSLDKAISSNIKTSLHNIPNFRDARFAGTSKKSKDCTIYFVEGVSALQLTEVGLSVIGNDYNGIFALKGKPLNTDLSIEALRKNEELKNICTVLGLRFEKECKLEDLRYGSVRMMSDADADGSHIKGLIIFMFYNFWPNLLKIPKFLGMINTPIVVSTKSKNERRSFLTLESYRKWSETLDEKEKSKWKDKYYKGLATSKKEDAIFYFENIKQYEKYFSELTPEDEETLEMVLNKKNSHKRKKWLEDYDAKNVIEYETIEELTIRDYIHKDFKHFSWYSVQRGIPSMEDGFTLASRKCVWVMLNSNKFQTEEIKVDELASEIAKETVYHHGKTSLESTIVGLAQNFPMAQNINLLSPDGIFGSRIDGGKSHGASRYLTSKLSSITPYIFPKDDFGILPKQEDEKQEIEPVFMTPIIPISLVNGSNNIATAYSSMIPCYNPLELIDLVQKKIENNEEKFQLSPWYDQFKGTIELLDEKGTFQSFGKVQETKPILVRKKKEEKEKKRKNTNSQAIERTIYISELPIGKWRDDYKKHLVKMIEEKKISDMFEDHTESEICFEIVLNDHESWKTRTEKEWLEFFKLSTKFNPQLNMLKQEENHKFHVMQYSSISELFEDWFQFRKEMYEKRHAYILKHLQEQLPTLEKRKKFIQAVLEKKIQIGKHSVKEIENLLSFTEEEVEKFMKITLKQLTPEKIPEMNQEFHNLQQKISQHKQTSSNQLWLEDITQLRKHFPLKQ